MLGGGEHSFLDLLSHLPPPWDVLAVVPQEGELAVKLRAGGITPEVLPLPSLRPWLAPVIAKALTAYWRFCKKHQPGLIYANGSRAAFYGGLVGCLMNIPVLWHCRVADSDPYVDSLLTHLCNQIVANSHATARRFSQGLNNKVKLIYNGIDLKWVKGDVLSKPEWIGADWKVILFIARVSRWKRHDLALKALESIADVEPKVHLVCVGAKDRLDPEWWEHLQVLTSQSPFLGRVHWIGEVQDIRPWLRSSSLLLLTSDNEPFGRVLVEAMACGLPVIATRSGGVPEIVREGIDGILVSPGSANEVCEAVLKLFRNEDLRKSLSESGRKRAEEFSIERHLNQMVEVFEETLRDYARRGAR